MKILFVMPGAGYLRHYESTVRLLASRGHEVLLSFDREEDDGAVGNRAKERLRSDHPNNIALGMAPERKDLAWASLATAVRLFMDYLRYFHPKYKGAEILRERMQEKIPNQFLSVYRFVHKWSGLNERFIMRILGWLERVIPPDENVIRWMSGLSPDAVLVTPLVYFGSAQVEYIKCARALKIRCGLCVASWDNLTNKGLIRLVPDRVFVWNQIQKDEAIELHGVPADRVVVTGAQTFDEWFDRKPTLSREEFCRDIGIDTKRPFILYLCSSKFIAPHEAKFVEHWLRRLRGIKNPRLRDAGVLIRPHPKNFIQWAYSDVKKLGNVAVWPPNGEGAVESEAKDGFFNSLYYSATVVGINTSALIEAGIVGRTVHTILAPEFQRTQQGTLHFHYLLNAGDGLLRVAGSFDEHFEQLADALSGHGVDTGKGSSFVSTFVRPFGLNVPAAPRLTAAIEAIGVAVVEQPWRSPWLTPAFRVLLYPLAAICQGVWFRHKKGAARKTGLLRAILPDPESAWMRAIVSLVGRITLIFIMARLHREQKRRQEALDRKPGAWDKFRDGWTETMTSSVSSLVGFSTRVNRFVSVRLAAVRRLAPGWVLRRLEDVTPWLSRFELGIQHGSKLRSASRIVAGPWLGDVWTELFLWIPFLNWMRAAYALAPGRLLAVSRGGAALWYRPVTTQYMDALDQIAPEELRKELDSCRTAGGDYWQSKKSPIDQTVLSRLKRANKIELQDLFHPRVLFKMFRPLLENKSLRFLLSAYVRRFARFEGLYGADTTVEPIDGLPKDYVAVKLYFNDCFPDTPQNRRFLTDMMRDLTRRTDVVLLTSPFQLNDHPDFRPESMERVFAIDHLMTPVNNLSVQTRVIRGAKAYVGPYGGFVYIAPLHGVKAYGFYSDAKRLDSSGQKLKQKICKDAGFEPVVLMDANAQSPRTMDALDLPASPVLVGG